VGGGLGFVHQGLHVLFQSVYVLLETGLLIFELRGFFLSLNSPVLQRFNHPTPLSLHLLHALILRVVLDNDLLQLFMRELAHRLQRKRHCLLFLHDRLVAGGLGHFLRGFGGLLGVASGVQVGIGFLSGCSGLGIL
jgi:hypothetical protein